MSRRRRPIADPRCTVVLNRVSAGRWMIEPADDASGPALGPFRSKAAAVRCLARIGFADPRSPRRVSALLQAELRRREQQSASGTNERRVTPEQLVGPAAGSVTGVADNVPHVSRRAGQTV